MAFRQSLLHPSSSASPPNNSPCHHNDDCDNHINSSTTSNSLDMDNDTTNNRNDIQTQPQSLLSQTQLQSPTQPRVKVSPSPSIPLSETSVLQAERALAQCHFQRAWNIAKQILVTAQSHHNSIISHPPPPPAVVPSKRHFNSLALDLTNVVPESPDNSHSGRHLFLHVSITKSCNDDDDDDNNNDDDNDAAIEERAAAVILQSSYELWKQQSFHLDANTFLAHHLRPFWNLYGSGSTPTTTATKTISLDLAVLWIQFARAVEWYAHAFRSCWILLVECLPHVALYCDEDDEDDEDDDWDVDQEDLDSNGNVNAPCQASCECLHLMLLRYLPFMNLETVQSILDKLCPVLLRTHPTETTNPANEPPTNDENDAPLPQNLLCSEQPTSSAIHAIQHSLQTIFSTETLSTRNDSLVWECIRTCLEELQSMDTKQLKSQHSEESGDFKTRRNHTSTPFHPTNKEQNTGTTTTTTSTANDPSTTIMGDTAQTNLDKYLLDPLWYSEHRWYNRTRVVGVGLLTILAWRKRRNVYRAGRSVPTVLLAPFREIVDAIAALPTHS